MNTKNILLLFTVAILSSALTLFTYKWAGFEPEGVVFKEAKSDSEAQGLARLTKDSKVSTDELVPNFTIAAQKTTSNVVHIIATQQVARNRNNMPDIFREFFGDDFGRNFRSAPRGSRQAQSSGSGVIVSEDGYIVTNNHVVEGASEIEVITADKNTYQAKVVGTAPSTDLAVIKVEAKDLPAIILGNSDEVNIGEWVLAVGNPFNLESTVTAGIVSAKGRSLNILREKSQTPIEAFIQTDAAVNPGNSGGALVNTRGELIGINTAIATPTGTYAGYSFAVPVNIVKKVMQDLIEFGTIQRGYLGVTIRDVDGNFAREQGLEITRGVYINQVQPDGAAKKAGIQDGDVIVGIDGKTINSSPELLEQVAAKRPGDQIEVKIYRDGKTKTISVTLQNKTGKEELIGQETSQVLKMLGADLEELSPETRQKLRLEGGVKVSRIFGGKLGETGMREGFIITELNERPVRNVEEFLESLQNIKGGVFLTGIYPGVRGEYYYAFGM